MAVEIRKTSREFDKKERYLLTLSPSMESVKDLEDGTKIEVDGYCEFVDVDEDTGDITELLSIITPEKKVYACQSATFRKSLYDMAEIFDDGEKFVIIKTSGKTKANRDFVNCILDVSAL